MTGILTWHGSQRWAGTPELRECRKGQYECGPGIYSTTSLNTASKHSRGGGRILQLTLSPDITWLEDVKIPFDDAIQFVKSSKHIHKRRILQDDLHMTYERRDRVRLEGMLPLTYLVNLAVNNECLSGKGGPELAEFLAGQGAQASLHTSSVNDDWVIVFDPKVILAYDIKSSKDIDWTADQLPKIAEQLTRLQTAPSI